jgi:pyridinium-3,5-bisthiocarboxylic acid mononucleotide nickel chelatase
LEIRRGRLEGPEKIRVFARAACERWRDMRVLFLDCFSGISGDMTVGALCDLGVKPSALEWELSKLDIGDFHTHFDRRQRQHIEGVKFSIHEGATHRKDQDEPCKCGHHHEHGHEHSHEHGHAHEHEKHEEHHHHGANRTHADIRRLIEKSTLSDFVKGHALSIFHRIAVAEGKIHGQAVEKVHFHEVGALDSIADIVCVCAGIEVLGLEKVFVSPLTDGRGFVETAHGKFPIPAPATVEILSGVPLGQIDEPYEFITPTGAAIVAEFGAGFGVMPSMKIGKVGYGVGTREHPTRPNVLRAVLGELETQPAIGFETDTVTRIEANLDDLSPEIVGATMEKLLAVGALDVFFTPIQMKKNRPASLLTVLCEPKDATRLARLVLTETSSFGVRMDDVRRLKLARRFEKVATQFGEVTVKLGLLDGAVVQCAPEFESCRTAADKGDVPLRVVFEAATQAARDAGFAPKLR